MADVSNLLQNFHNQQELEKDDEEQQSSCVQPIDSSITGRSSINDDNVYRLDFSLFSPPNLSFLLPSSSSSSSSSYQIPHIFSTYSDSVSNSDYRSDYSDSRSDYSDSITDMNFVTNLFESIQFYVPDDEQNSVSHPFLETVNENLGLRVFGSHHAEEEELGSAFGVEIKRADFASESDEYSSNPVTDSTFYGLRVAGIDSDSDIEEADGIGDEDSDLGLPDLWSCIQFDDQRSRNEEFEWEEVDGRIDDREALRSVIDRIEEISVPSEISSEEEEDDSVNAGEDNLRSLEWEVLLAVNDFERDLEFQTADGEGVTYLAVQDDYIYAAEYNTLFGQFLDTESALKGSPPAAKSVVENLPSLVLTEEYVQVITLSCAVCKDDIVVGDRATQLPCSHHYHGDCILPWLNIRNTCPICRFELPTDDADYEQRKEGRHGLG